MKKANKTSKALRDEFREGIEVLSHALKSLSVKQREFNKKKCSVEEEIKNEGRKTKGFYIKLPIR